MGVLSKVTNYALSHDPKIALTESELRQLKLSLDIPESVFFMFQMTFCIITPALIVGAYPERMKFQFVLLYLTHSLRLK